MNSLGSWPCLALAFSTSAASSLRLELAMSAVPLRRAAMPMPEPPPTTSTETEGSTLWYSSAQAWARLTMVSEPMFWTLVALAEPEPPPALLLLLQPGWVKQMANRMAMTHGMVILSLVFIVWLIDFISQNCFAEVVDVFADELVGGFIGRAYLLR